MSEQNGFLSRWSRRKVQAREGVALEEPTPPTVEASPQAAGTTQIKPPVLPVPAVDAPIAAVEPPSDSPRPPAPTLTDVTALTRESDFSRFVAPGVDGEVKNAALKKLFSDPHFNVMDGLDTYIDDYNKPDPLPLSSVRKMAQAAFLGLVDPEPPALEAAASVAPATPTAQAPKSAEIGDASVCAAIPEPDENADLRLQSHDAAGCGGAENSAAADGPVQP